jgi:hypothetical protein
VEPLQIVSYTDGQRFDLHHDAGTLTDDGEIDIVQPRRYDHGCVWFVISFNVCVR